MKLVPDLATWRLLPWLPKTALVFCDVYTEEGEPIEEAPRWVLAGRSSARSSRGSSSRRRPSSSSTLQGILRRGARQALPRPHARVELPRGLPHPADLAGGGLVRAIRNHMEAARVPVEFSKGEWGRGQEEINLRYAEALEMADRHVLYKHGVKEIARQQGARSRSWRSTTWARRARPVTSTRPVGPAAGGRTSSPRKVTAAGRRSSGTGSAGQMAMAREFAYFYAPTINSYKRYQAGSSRRPGSRAGWDNRTCGFRICGEGAGFRVENRIPGADANPYLAFAATIAAGLHGIAEEARRRPPSTRATRTRTRGSPRCRRRCARPSTSSIGRRSARAASGRRWSSTTSTPPARAAGVRPGGHRLGAHPPLRAHLAQDAEKGPSASSAPSAARST